MSIFQEELYELILQTNKECLKLCKPGASIRQIHNYSVLDVFIYSFIFFGIVHQLSPFLRIKNGI